MIWFVCAVLLAPSHAQCVLVSEADTLFVCLSLQSGVAAAHAAVMECGMQIGVLGVCIPHHSLFSAANVSHDLA